MTLAMARTIEDQAREKVLAYLRKAERPLPAAEIITAILTSSKGTFSFEVVRRAIINLMDQGQLELTEERTVRLAA